MDKYTQEQLTNLLTTDREKLTRICAEVCYGWKQHPYDKNHFLDADGALIYFVPLIGKARGRSQAFELAVKFNVFTTQEIYDDSWTAFSRGKLATIVRTEDPQSAIVIAAILTAQELQK